MCSVSLGAIPIPLSVTVISAYCCNGFGRVESLPVRSRMSTLPPSGVNLKALDRMFRIILSKFTGSTHNFKWSAPSWWNCKVICFLFACSVKVSHKSLMNPVISVSRKTSDICPLSILRISINWFTSRRILSELRQMMR